MKKGYIVLMVLLFIVGGFLVTYPIFSNWYNDNFQGRAIDEYQTEVDNRTEEENEEILQKMTDYNKMLAMGLVEDPGKDQPVIDFEGMDLLLDGLEKEFGVMLGIIKIPAIKLECPIFEGVTTIQLQRGVGVLPGTSLPVGGKNTHSVITGHRGLPTAKLFTDLPDVGIGDVFYIEIFNNTLAYEVREINTILPEDVESLRIVPDDDVVTLLTCVPYMINTHRLIVSGHRIPYEEKTPGEDSEMIVSEWLEIPCCEKLIIVIILGVLLLFMMLLFIYIKVSHIWKLEKKKYDETHGQLAAAPHKKGDKKLEKSAENIETDTKDPNNS